MDAVMEKRKSLLWAHLALGCSPSSGMFVSGAGPLFGVSSVMVSVCCMHTHKTRYATSVDIKLKPTSWITALIFEALPWRYFPQVGAKSKRLKKSKHGIKATGDIYNKTVQHFRCVLRDLQLTRQLESFPDSNISWMISLRLEESFILKWELVLLFCTLKWRPLAGSAGITPQSW